jgi:uncharacterized membrane protein YphA (DoxX/SURF4 family)
MTKKFLIAARIFVGIVFIFSGFVKGIDPWGFNYKLTDYTYSMHLTWMQFLTFPGAFILPFLEFLIGASLVSGLFFNIASKLSLLFMAVFTPLTLYIALKNPVTDCGCFGDALVITNWETFYKNIVLIILAFLIFRCRKKVSLIFPSRISKILFSFFSLMYILLVFWSFYHEPILDFRPYKVGVNITQGMTVPRGAPADVYKTNYYYRNLKTNEVKKFNENNYPWQDSLNWKFESMDNPVLVKKGYTPPIHDFFIQNDQGENIADFFLQDDSFLFVVVSHDLEKASLKKQAALNQLASWAKDSGYKFICLTASKGSTLESFKAKAAPNYEFYFGDEITLKTIIRSNPGLLLLKKGTILDKWSNCDIPDARKMEKKIIPEMKKKLIHK